MGFYKPMSTPVVALTIISGFYEAGKSSIVESLRRSLKGARVAFLNEGECEEDLVSTIDQAAVLEGAEAIVLESLGWQEPFLLADLLTKGTPFSSPSSRVRVDTLATVVDVSRVLVQLLDDQDLIDLPEGGCDPEDGRSVAEVLIEQIEYADVLVLNKTDLVSEAELRRVEEVLGRLNPRARLVRAQPNGVIPAESVIATGLYDYDETDEGSGWLAELSGEYESHPKSPFGLSSFTYLERRPFHPERLAEFLEEADWDGLIRAKGSVWISTRHQEIGIWSLSGRSSLLTCGGNWFASTPGRDWPRDEQERYEIMADWAPPFGDRRQEIAFIGIGLDEMEIRRRLNRCLLTAHEMVDGPDSWYALPDPLPDWHQDSGIES